MANTIDNFTLKVNVEGTAQIKTATADIQNLDKATTTAGKNMGAAAQNIRNVGFQVQDFTVQVANGTSAITALSQQLPQLLSNFGTIGVYLGIAAAAIPIVAAGFKLLGGDARDLDTRIKDLTDSVKNYQDAQKANQSTLAGLGDRFGSLTSVAKDFFDTVELLRKQKVDLEIRGALEKLNKDFAVLSVNIGDLEKQIGSIGAGYAATGISINQTFKAMELGLTAEQAQKVADKIKQIDANKPEEAAAIIRDITSYLASLGTEGDKALKRFEALTEPLIKLNAQILSSRENLRASAQEASNFRSEILLLQASFIPRIGEARRAYNQIAAVRLEGEARIAEFTKNALDQSAKDQIDRSKEIAAFRTKTAAEIADKERDIRFQQEETYKAAKQANDIRLLQLGLEKDIIDIRSKNIFALDFQLKLDEKLLQNSFEYRVELEKINEQLRKGQITPSRAQELKDQTNLIKGEKDILALKDANAAAIKKNITDQIAINAKSIDDQISRLQTLDEVIKGVSDKITDLQFIPDERSLSGLNSLQQGYVQIEASARKAALEQGRVFAAKFTGDLTPEQAKELADGLDQIAAAFGRLAEKQKENAQANYEFKQKFETGWNDAFAKYVEDANNSARKAQNYFENFTRGFEDAIVRFVQTGKLSFKDLANSLIAEFARNEIKNLLKPILGGGGFLSKLFGFKTGSTEAAGAAVLGLPGFAKGGYLPSGQLGIVGEKGPEYITGPANITPIENIQPSANITYNINAVDAASFRSLVARDPQFIFQVTEAGRRSQPTRRLG